MAKADRGRTIACWALLVLIASGAAIRELPYGRQTESRNLAANQVTAHIDTVMARYDRGEADIVNGGRLTWRIALDMLDQNDPLARSLGALLLQVFAEKRPEVRPAAISAIEVRATHLRSDDPLMKVILLLTVASIHGFPPDGATSTGIEHEARCHEVGYIDAKARSFAETMLGSPRISTQLSALPVVLGAGDLRNGDRLWARRIIERQIDKSEAIERDFWVMAHGALTGRLRES
jgi:hypothetical protein